MYKSDNPLFRDLTDEEEKKFIKWADENEEEATILKVEIYHPVIIKRWKEKGLLKKDGQDSDHSV